MTIAEVSKKYDISRVAIRYYERIRLILSVNRNKSGIRKGDSEGSTAMDQADKMGKGV